MGMMYMEVKNDQHMMVASNIIGKIVDSADIAPNETVLEIGPGTGNLTRELAKKAGKVIAVEIDRRFAPPLKKIKNVEVIIGNALDEISSLEFDKIVSNIPYAICEPLAGKLIETGVPAVLTVPRGFADILTAERTDEQYSRISLLVQAFFDVGILFDISREAFEPAPKTDSVAVKLSPRTGNELQKEVFKRQKLKLKNAIMRALFTSRKMAKNDARKAIKTLKLSNNLLEKRLLDADLNELDAVLGSLESFKNQ